MRSTFCVSLQRLKTSLVPLFKEFNILKQQWHVVLFWFTLNSLFYCFWGVFNFHSCLFEVSTLNAPGMLYFFVYRCWKENIYVSCGPSSLKTSIVGFFLLWDLDICCAVRCFLFLFFWRRYFCFFCSFSFNCIKGTYLVGF